MVSLSLEPLFAKIFGKDTLPQPADISGSTETESSQPVNIEQLPAAEVLSRPLTSTDRRRIQRLQDDLFPEGKRVTDKYGRTVPHIVDDEE